MARRRMIDPSFWTDSDVRKLTKTERLLLIGMMSIADDEGRLQAHPSLLKATIFPYDDDIDLADIREMRDRIAQVMRNVILYSDNERDEEYIAFLKWREYQKPSHPKPSKIPPPPDIQKVFQDTVQESVQESVQDTVREGCTPRIGQSSLDQSSLGQVRLGKDRLGAVLESFQDGFQEKFKIFGIDLTDFKDLTDYDFEEIFRAENEMIMAEFAVRWWKKHVNRAPKKTLLECFYRAFQEHPPDVVAAAMLKAARYGGGKSWNYMEKIIEELERKANGGA